MRRGGPRSFDGNAKVVNAVTALIQALPEGFDYGAAKDQFEALFRASGVYPIWHVAAKRAIKTLSESSPPPLESAAPPSNEAGYVPASERGLPFPDLD